MNEKRPNLNKEINIKDFKDFYWLKSELMNFCREIGISSSGGKIEIANRRLEYLETGKVDIVLSWRHTGFGVYCGKRINPKEARSTENLARYTIRASFSQERMKYFPD